MFRTVSFVDGDTKLDATEMNAPVRRKFGRQVQHFLLRHVSVWRWSIWLVRKRGVLDERSEKDTQLVRGLFAS
jgi:hypothetical protein